MYNNINRGRGKKMMKNFFFYYFFSMDCPLSVMSDGRK